MILKRWGWRRAAGFLTAGAASSVFAARARCDEEPGGRDGPAPICLFTDLDGTFVDYKDKEKVGRDLECFFEYWEEFERPRGSVLVYNTARSIKMYEHLPADFPEFRPPDVLITGEGTEIRWLRAPSSPNTAARSSSSSSHGHDDQSCKFEIDDVWADRIREHWWRSGLRERVRAALDAIDEHCIGDLNVAENALNEWGEARHAVTIRGGPGSEQRVAELLEVLGGELNSGPDRVVELAGFPAWGEDPKPHIITALPSCAGKGKSARYVAERLGIPEERCVCAGDTLGDLALLEDAGGMSFFAVANARGGLKEAVARKRRALAGDHPFPRTVGGTGAAGVLEGLQRFTAS